MKQSLILAILSLALVLAAIEANIFDHPKGHQAPCPECQDRGHDGRCKKTFGCVVSKRDAYPNIIDVGCAKCHKPDPNGKCRPIVGCKRKRGDMPCGPCERQLRARCVRKVEGCTSKRVANPCPHCRY